MGILVSFAPVSVHSLGGSAWYPQKDALFPKMQEALLREQQKLDEYMAAWRCTKHHMSRPSQPLHFPGCRARALRA